MLLLVSRGFLAIGLRVPLGSGDVPEEQSSSGGSLRSPLPHGKAYHCQTATT